MQSFLGQKCVLIERFHCTLSHTIDLDAIIHSNVLRSSSTRV